MARERSVEMVRIPPTTVGVMIRTGGNADADVFLILYPLIFLSLIYIYWASFYFLSAFKEGGDEVKTSKIIDAFTSDAVKSAVVNESAPINVEVPKTSTLVASLPPKPPSNNASLPANNADDETEGGARVPKKKRVNWYSNANHYVNLKRAGDSFRRQKKKNSKLSAKYFCENYRVAKGIHDSVLRRYLAKQGNEMYGQGRRFKCDILTSQPSNDNEVVGKLGTYDHICPILKLFEWQNLKRYQGDKRRKKEAFVFTADVYNENDPWLGLPDAADILSYSSLHIVVFIKRHYIYVHVKKHRGMYYYDSRKYKSNKQIAMNIMDKVASKIQNLSTRYFHDNKPEKEMIEERPQQSNDVDCGVFVLFFADCTRKGFAMKPHLSDEEITNYRGVIGRYLTEYEMKIANGCVKRILGKRKIKAGINDCESIEIKSD